MGTVSLSTTPSLIQQQHYSKNKKIQLQFVTAPGSFLSHILDLIDVFGFYVVLHSVTLQVTYSGVFYDPSHILLHITQQSFIILDRNWPIAGARIMESCLEIYVCTPLYLSLSLF